jgi:hypothetical protein
MGENDKLGIIGLLSDSLTGGIPIFAPPNFQFFQLLTN